MAAERVGMSDVVTEMPLNRHVSWEGLEHEVTPTSEFFCRNHNPFPEPPQVLEWAGHSLTMEQLAAMPQVEQVVTLECAGNGRTDFSPVPSGTPWGTRGLSTARFRGVAVASLLKRYPASEDTRHVIFQGADGAQAREGLYERSLSLDEIKQYEPLLALEMNGLPLPLQHGAPVRLVVPGYYAMTSIKWLCRASYSPTPSQGYFQVQDYLVDYQDESEPIRPVTVMKPKSILVWPRQDSQLRGPLTVRGKAWSGEGAVTGVDLVVSGPGGERRLAAELGDALGRYAWRSFSAELTLSPGRYTLQAFCRAGQLVQPEQARWNVQGYENNSAPTVSFEVVGE
jgi:DMSO/TMAO reductase YedYZ molybdopterin-dependent catalytic subunit